MKQPSTPANSASILARRHRLQPRAFTIVEVMMAAMVMAFAITTSITTLQRGFLSIDTARNFVIAGQIIQSEIEKMRVSLWSTTATVPGLADYTDNSPAIVIDAAFTSNPFISDLFTPTRTMSDPKTEIR